MQRLADLYICFSDGERNGYRNGDWHCHLDANEYDECRPGPHPAL
jgi:hypothetical protein